MGKLRLFGFFALVLIVVVLLSLVYINKKSIKKDEQKDFVEPPVIEFPPLKLCKETGGEWKVVNASQFPFKEEEGVYKPSTNPEMNYKCFCLKGTSWNISRGCVK